MTARLHDISRPIRAGIPVWPGDTPFDFRFVAKIADGSSVNVGRIEMSVHTGSHVDAPLHFDDAGADAASVAIEKYVGPCVVADVRPSDRGILPEHLPETLDADARACGRVLLRSYAQRPEGFDEHMAHATPLVPISSEWKSRSPSATTFASSASQMRSSLRVGSPKEALRNGTAWPGT